MSTAASPPRAADRAAGAGPSLVDRLARSQVAIAALGSELGRLDAWGQALAERLGGGGRLLAAGNGGSAALAQHLVGELVGRFERERQPYSALALCAETATLTAIGNDYGYDESFARQVRAHGRDGDVLVALSTSGRSPNLIGAAEAARLAGLVVWAMTGPRPNPLADAAHDALAVPVPSTACIQDAHQVAVHLLCAAFDACVGGGGNDAPNGDGAA
jgi:phosphoheptose isomerase